MIRAWSLHCALICLKATTDEEANANRDTEQIQWNIDRVIYLEQIGIKSATCFKKN